MRPSHPLCSLVLSIPRSSAAISDRPSHDSSSASPSRKRSRSPTASVSLSSPIPRALSSACVDLLPSPKRIRNPESTMDLEVSSAEGFEPSRYKGTDLEMDDTVERSDGINIDPEIQSEINECIAYADALRVRGIDARVPAQNEGAVEGHRIVATGQQSADMLERIQELERDNIRLRDMMDVASQRDTRSQRRETMPNTQSGASRKREGINKQIDHRLAGALVAYDATRNLKPLIGGGGEQEEVNGNKANGNGVNGNGGNRNGGNGNRGNGNGGNGNG
ncbi:hypothetical protein Tco_1278363 [Tanacetum coccineum]